MSADIIASLVCPRLKPVVVRSKLDPGLSPHNSSSILYFLSMLPQHLAQAIFYTTAPLPHSSLHVGKTLTLSSSPKITLRSLCPTRLHAISLSFNCSVLISPVNAPFGLSNTFCAATSISFFKCSRASRRYREGGAMTTSIVGVGEG